MRHLLILPRGDTKMLVSHFSCHHLGLLWPTQLGPAETGPTLEAADRHNTLQMMVAQSVAYQLALAYAQAHPAA